MKRLTMKQIHAIDTPGTYSDGPRAFGLFLRVQASPASPDGVRMTWAQRVRIGGRVTNLGLGSWPKVTLAAARLAALENARRIHRGEDPRTPTLPTFREVAREVIQLHRKAWTAAITETHWKSSLAQNVYPKIGQKRIDKITTADVLAVLRPIWSEKPALAAKVRQRIGAVMKYALAQGYRLDNPAGDAIEAAMPNKSRPVHMEAVPHPAVPAAVEALRNGGGSIALAAEFVVLTACRSIEAFGARWDEIDGDLWTIPAARAKTRTPHQVPLSRAALAVLAQARAATGGRGLIFPAPRSGKPLGRSTVRQHMKRAKVPGTVHGFRSSFRDWCAETGVAREVAEACLAHVVKGVEGAYLRSTLLERRRPVMERWGDYAAPGGQ